jgi:transcriptional regulator with XRE-family HTH domain
MEELKAELEKLPTFHERVNFLMRKYGIGSNKLKRMARVGTEVIRKIKKGKGKFKKETGEKIAKAFKAFNVEPEFLLNCKPFIREKKSKEELEREVRKLKTLAERLLYLKTELGLTYKEMKELTGVDYSKVSSSVKSHNSVPKKTTLVKIANGVGINPSILLEVRFNEESFKKFIKENLLKCEKKIQEIKEIFEEMIEEVGCNKNQHIERFKERVKVLYLPQIETLMDWITEERKRI